MIPTHSRNERTTFVATLLGGLALAVASTGSVAAAFFTGLITTTLGVLFGSGALELLKSLIPSLF